MRLIVCFTLGSLLAACGDDYVPKQPRPDGPPTPDAPPGPEFKGYDADEGGEVRVEYIKFPSGGVGTRTTAFVFKNPGSTKYFDYLNLNGCTDMTPKDKWPMATNPIGEREYYDVGPYIVISGGPDPLEVPKNPNMANDPFARTHPAGEWYFDGIMGTDMNGGQFLTEKTVYDVTFPGSDEFPGQIYDDVIYMPADFALETPGHAGPLLFPANTAQTFTWTTPADTPPAGYMVLSLVAFTGASGPAVICVEPNDGSITVPADMMDIARATYPTGGQVARQTLTHAVRELVDANGPTGRRIDFLGVWCYAGTTFVAQ